MAHLAIRHGLPRLVAFCAVFLLSGLFLAGCVTDSAADSRNHVADETILRIADRLREQGDIRLAADFYQRAAQAMPDDPAPRLGLARIFDQQGMQTEAMKMYAEAFRLGADDGEARQSFARMLMRAQMPEEAARQYEEILDDDSGDVKARNGLGVALDMLGRHDEAQRQYRKGLAEDRDNLGIINNLGYSLILSKKYDDAITLLAPAAMGPRGTPQLRQNLAAAYAMSGKYAEAEHVASVDLSPDEVDNLMAKYRTGAAQPSEESVEKYVKAREGVPLPPVPQANEEPMMQVQKPAPQAAPAPTPESVPVKKAVSTPVPQKNVKLMEPKTPPQPDAQPVIERQSSPWIQLFAPPSENQKNKTQNFARGSGSSASNAMTVPMPMPESGMPPVRPMADFGLFDTEPMAKAFAARARDRFDELDDDNVVIDIMPELASTGIARFRVRASGFDDPDDVRDLCEDMVERKLNCTMMGIQ